MVISICVACMAIGAFGYWLYEEQNRTGIALSVGGHSIAVEAR
jgi:hypothetical protein